MQNKVIHRKIILPRVLIDFFWWYGSIKKNLFIMFSELELREIEPGRILPIKREPQFIANTRMFFGFKRPRISRKKAEKKYLAIMHTFLLRHGPLAFG
jgi:hypothetical protein